MRNYQNINYARDRLVGTIVRVGGKAVTVMDFIDHAVSYKELISGKNASIDADLMDITPVPLGYVNSAGFANYIMRIPKRQDWKQGLRQATMYSSAVHPEEITLPDLGRTIEGLFPNLFSVMKTIRKGEVSSMAFHREWAVMKNNRVLYKGNYDVGTIDEMNNINLTGNFDWLSESLEEAIG